MRLSLLVLLLQIQTILVRSVFQAAKDIDELIDSYRFLSAVANTNLPKKKAYIKRAAKGLVLLSKKKSKINGVMFFEFMPTHISLTNLYVDNFHRFNFVLLKDILEIVAAMQKRYAPKEIYIKSSDVSEYKHFVIPIEDDTYKIRKI